MQKFLKKLKKLMKDFMIVEDLTKKSLYSPPSTFTSVRRL